METMQAPSNDDMFDNETSLRVERFLSLIQAEEEWRNQADCKDMPSERFMPSDDQLWTRRETKFAKSICARCVVVEECLEYALNFSELPGVWGGLTLKQREEIRRPR